MTDPLRSSEQSNENFHKRKLKKVEEEVTLLYSSVAKIGLLFTVFI
jgi:hypothetical protein